MAALLTSTVSPMWFGWRFPRCSAGPSPERLPPPPCPAAWSLVFFTGLKPSEYRTRWTCSLACLRGVGFRKKRMMALSPRAPCSPCWGACQGQVSTRERGGSVSKQSYRPGAPPCSQLIREAAALPHLAEEDPRFLQCHPWGRGMISAE